LLRHLKAVPHTPNAAVRGAFLSDPHDGVIGIIVSGFALLYPTYEIIKRKEVTL